MNLHMAVNNSNYQENDIDVDMFLANDTEKVPPVESEYTETKQAPKRKETPTRPQGRTKRRVQNPPSRTSMDTDGPPPKRPRANEEEREGGEVEDEPEDSPKLPPSRSAIPAIIHQPLPPNSHLPRLNPLPDHVPGSNSPVLPPIHAQKGARGQGNGKEGAVEALTVLATEVEEKAPISEKMRNLKLRLKNKKVEGEPVPVHKKVETKAKPGANKERTPKDLNHILDNNSSPNKRGMKRRHSQLGEEEQPPRLTKQQPEPLHHLAQDPAASSPAPRTRSSSTTPATPPHDEPAPPSRKGSQARPKRTSRSNSEVAQKSDEDYENETDEEKDSRRERVRPKRERKRTASVQRAIDEEMNRGSTTKSRTKKSQIKESEEEQEPEEEEKPKPKPKPKTKKPKTRQRKPKAPTSSDDEDHDKGSEDGVLAIDKFLLKRYNTETNEIEYLVQWNGYDIHKSGWIGKKDIFAAEYLNEFEKEWAEIVEKKKQKMASKASEVPGGDQGKEGEAEKPDAPEKAEGDGAEKKTKKPAPPPPKPPQNVSVGDKIWVKLKGHQWWPAQIVVHKQPAPDKNDYTVIYYGENTFSFVNDYNPSLFSLEEFEGNEEKYRKKANDAAVKEAIIMRLEDSFE